MLDKNENPYAFPVFSLDVQMLNRYPDASYLELKEILAKTFNAYGSCYYSLGNGSDEVLQNIFNAFTLPGDLLVTIAPTFSEYKRMAQIRTLKYAPYVLEFPYVLDVDLFIAYAVYKQPSLTIICNPNNPTGCVLSQEALFKILNEVPGTIVIDEAYIDFGGTSMIDYIDHYPHLVVLRTLSKGFALAGLRFGFSVSSPESCTKIEAVRAPYNLSALTVMAIKQVLKQEHPFIKNIDLLVQMRDEIQNTLTQHAIDFVPSQANFILVKTKSRKTLAEQLSSEALSVRYFEDDDLVRFTIGLPHENEKWLSILIKTIKGAENDDTDFQPKNQRK